MIWYSKFAGALPQWSQVWTPNDCFTCIVSMQQYGIPGAVNYGHVNKMLRISIDWNVLGRLKWSMFMYVWYPYIYINIHIMRNLQDYVVLWAVDMCQLIFARNHAKAIAGQGLSMSPSWYIIWSVITWREYDLTIISPESHVGYLGTKY